MSQTRIPLPAFRTILFATDLSEATRDAFTLACALARQDGSQLIVLFVDEPLPSLEQIVGYNELGAPIFLPNDVPADAASPDRLRKLYVPASTIAVDYQVRKGDAADEILHMAEEVHCDLLVLGTHGRAGLDRLLIGSVAEAVMRNAACPTLTVRSRAVGSAPGVNPTPSGLRTILLATDFSRHSEAALRVARGMARDHGARVVVVHVVEPALKPAASAESAAQDAIGREALERVGERAAGFDLKYAVEVQLRRGDAATEILAAATEVECDLIVVGSHGRSGLQRLLVGSVAEAVMRQAHCPVLTVKATTPTTSNVECVAAGDTLINE